MANYFKLQSKNCLKQRTEIRQTLANDQDYKIRDLKKLYYPCRRSMKLFL